MACGCRRGGKAARGTPVGLCAEPGFPEKHYLEPEKEVNLQGQRERSAAGGECALMSTSGCHGQTCLGGRGARERGRVWETGG
ncbi:unnamed protein product [Rangifer tarandus platyrhynchus]